MNIFRHQEPHRINPIYGWGALLCNLGLHSYQRMSVWEEGTDWFQHDCKRCGHISWLPVRGGKEIGEKIFPSRSKR